MTSRSVLALGCAALLLARFPAQAQPRRVPPSRVQADSAVMRARQVQTVGRIPDAQRMLDSTLQDCGAAAEGRECRITVTAGLAKVYQDEGLRTRANSQVNLAQATKYWEQVLREDPSNTEAVYNKAQVFQRLAPAQATGFYQEAARIDPTRKAVYYAFLGDYQRSQRNWDEAARSYRLALDADPDEASARSGLTESLRRSGTSAVRELLVRGNQWAVWESESAAEAYGAALTVMLRDTARRGSESREAEMAALGLVSVQARNSRELGAAPGDPAAAWAPFQQLMAYLGGTLDSVSPGRDTPWWQAQPARRTVLAEASMAAARASLSRGESGKAERLLVNAEAFVQPASGIRVDLQRELAFLYYRRPELDQGGEKWKQLERRMFEGKGVALATNDAEAAQRFHSALGLIYAARNQWRREVFAHNASDQFQFVLDRIQQRKNAERFLQPVPEIREMLANGLESIGDRGNVAQLRLDAVAAWLDVNDLAQASQAVTNAERARADPARLERLNAIVRLRTELAGPSPRVGDLCGADLSRVIEAAGPIDFAQRQHFKILADCAARGDTAIRLSSAIRVFELIDGSAPGLVGSGDVLRLQRVMGFLLGAVGIEYHAPHLDRMEAPRKSNLVVTVPGETRPRWLTLDSDDLIAGRIVATLGSSALGLRFRVTEGVVVLSGRVPAEIVSRIRRVRGVVNVRERPISIS